MPGLLTRLKLGVNTAMTLTRTAPALPFGFLGGVDGAVRLRARMAPLTPMLRVPGRTMTAREVEAETNRYARFWQRRGIGPGDTVAVRMDACLAVPLHQLGLSRIGAAAALVNTQLPRESLAHVLQACGARALVVDAPVEAPDGLAVVDAAEVETALRGLSDREVRGTLKDGDAVFCYLFTSGTTGLPKAVPIRQRRFLLAGIGINGFGLWLDQSDVVFTPLPLYHASAQIVAWSAALASGACFAFTP